MSLRTIGLVVTLVLGRLVGPLPAEAQKGGGRLASLWVGREGHVYSDFLAGLEILVPLDTVPSP